MRRLFAALLQIGADANDDEDQRLRRVLVLAAVLMVMPAALGWGAIYWFFGEPIAALVPWAYSVIAFVGVGVFAVTRDYRVFAVSQFVPFIVLPFVLMWILGGFVSGSAVALWAWVAPLGARLVGHRRAALALFAAFGVGTVGSAILRPVSASGNNLADVVVAALFVLNVVGVAIITFVLVDAAAGGREETVVSMRGIVRRYFSPDVAGVILADPARQELGGEVVDVTILFADLGGYTTYSGERRSHEVLELLNTVFAAAVPEILGEGGTPVQLPGDAVMAIFGAPREQPAHALSAARAALGIQAAGRRLAVEHPDWPTFRIGLNSGEALVGNIGSDQFRNFTAIGDTTNMAQRFQTLAQPGEIVIGPETALRLGEHAELEPIGAVVVKGKSEPVEPAILRSLAAPDPRTTA